VLLITSAVWFNVWFTILARRFEYPEILRKPTDEILARFRAGGSSLILVWWAFMASGGLFLVSVVLLDRALGPDTPMASRFALVVGTLAALVQVLGLLRWVYLVPELARAHGNASASDASRAAAAVTFRAFHQYLGVGVGEHLGYLLTGAWTAIVGVVVLGGEVVGPWLGWVAIPIGLGLVVCSVEYLGPNEERGWPLAARAVPLLYVGWSLWLVALGVALIA
jgi:hypothetical protein